MKSLILLLLMFLCVVTAPVSGQTVDVRNSVATSCEENEASLDQMGSLLADVGHEGKRLLMIAHLGKGEFSADLINHRLYNASEYVLARWPSIARQRIIIARGERTDGLSRIDFWFEGKIVDSLFAKKNKTLCVDCCENRPIAPYKKNSWKTKL